MLVTRDIDEILERQRNIAARGQKRGCDSCRNEAGRDTCSGCIQDYLDRAQTLEDIRRM